MHLCQTTCLITRFGTLSIFPDHSGFPIFLLHRCSIWIIIPDFPAKSKRRKQNFQYFSYRQQKNQMPAGCGRAVRRFCRGDRAPFPSRAVLPYCGTCRLSAIVISPFRRRVRTADRPQIGPADNHDSGVPLCSLTAGRTLVVECGSACHLSREIHPGCEM